MSEPDEVAERLHRTLVHALTELLHASGFAGGVLVAVTPDGLLVSVSALHAEVDIEPAQLLRLTLAQLERRRAHDGQSGPPNG
jgi:hypothetical protein